jgi:hypothetical protein
LRAALGWSLDGGYAVVALRLAAELWGFWYKRGHLGEDHLALPGSHHRPTFLHRDHPFRRT